MRPDRIIVGECRSKEALDMLQAMNTGHDGCMTTIHSNGTRDTLSRIETMVLMAGADLPLRAIRGEVASAVDLVVYLAGLVEGSGKSTNNRQVLDLLEVTSLILTIILLYTFEHEVPRAQEMRLN